MSLISQKSYWFNTSEWHTQRFMNFAQTQIIVILVRLPVVFFVVSVSNNIRLLITTRMMQKNPTRFHCSFVKHILEIQLILAQKCAPFQIVVFPLREFIFVITICAVLWLMSRVFYCAHKIPFCNSTGWERKQAQGESEVLVQDAIIPSWPCPTFGLMGMTYKQRSHWDINKKSKKNYSSKTHVIFHFNN